MVIEDIFPGEGGISFLLVGCDSLYVLSLSAVIYSRKAVRKIDFLHAKLYNPVFDSWKRKKRLQIQ